MINKSRLTYSAATRFSVVFCAVAALALPIGYFLVSYEYLKGIMETEAEINSELVSRLINANPELWRYETIRIEELLTRRPRSGAPESRSIFDAQNSLIAESVNNLQSPRIKASREVMDGGEVAGRLEISRSMLPLLIQSGLLAIAGLCFGLLLYRWLPFQAVIEKGKQLQDANNFLRKVMEGSTNSLLVINLKGDIQLFNGRFEALTGFTGDDIYGKYFSGMFTGDAKAQVDTELFNIITDKEHNVTFETVFTRQDGLELNLFCGAVPLITDDTISGVIISLDDITDRISAEEERLELEQHLQQTQKLESLGVLAGGIAHDFNNILTIILGYCYIFKDETDENSDGAVYIQKIENAANRAAALCQQMLSYAGKNELSHSPIDMKRLVDELVKMLISGIKKNVTIETELKAVDVIIADSSQIQQIVMNLIINAAEAIGEDNGCIKITLEMKSISIERLVTDFAGKSIRPGKYVYLEVSDNGCGMDKETQKRIFEPFYTTKFAGRGLGMSATLGIIKNHGAALQFSSNPGIGTSFKVFLPLSESTGIAEIRPAFCPLPAVQGSGTVLLVDDEEELRVLGTIRLNKIGYSVITAANGLEAFDIYRNNAGNIDLILLDLLMPEMDGINTYYRLREMSRKVPVVFCSGCSKDDLPGAIIEDHYSGFLKKPYKPDQLRDILLEILG